MNDYGSALVAGRFYVHDSVGIYVDISRFYDFGVGRVNRQPFVYFRVVLGFRQRRSELVGNIVRQLGGFAGDYGVVRSEDTYIRNGDRIKYEEAVRKVPTTSMNTYSGSYNRFVTPIVTEKVYELAKKQKEDANRQLKLNVYKQALGLILSYENLANQEELLKIDQQKLERAYSNYIAGRITLDTYTSQQVTVENRKDTIADLKYDLEKKNMDFKLLLNIPMSEEDLVIEKVELKYDSPDTIDLKMVIQEALENDSTIYSRAMDVKIQEKVMELTEKFYDDDMAVYWQNTYNYKNALYNDDLAKINLEYNIRVAYNNLKSKYNKIKLAEKNLELREKTMNETYQMYRTQLTTWDSYISTVINYNSARYSLLSNQINYMIAKADFDYLIGR
jgi:hypothetical protein